VLSEAILNEACGAREFHNFATALGLCLTGSLGDAELLFAFLFLSLFTQASWDRCECHYV
jgi:hypothetical protein